MSDYETTQRRRNIVVGIFMIAGLCALVWMIFKFGDLPGFVAEVNSFQVFVQFPTATGIEKDAPVRFCGYQVGRVTSVMAPEERTDLNTGLKYYQAVVVLSIDKRYATIPSCVQVKLMTRGLGSSYIELKQCPGLTLAPREPNRPETKYLMNGMWLQGSTGMTSEFFPEESQKKLTELIDGINTFVANANEIIGDQQNKRNIKTTLANAAEASEQAKKTMKQFETLAAAGTTIIEHANAKMDKVVTTLTETGEQIQKFAAAGTSTLEGMDTKTQKLVTSLVDTSEQLSAAMAQLRLILDKINNGRGTAAKLVNDGRLYENLLENSNQLQKLLKDMQAFIADWRNKKVGVKLF